MRSSEKVSSPGRPLACLYWTCIQNIVLFEFSAGSVFFFDSNKYIYRKVCVSYRFVKGVDDGRGKKTILDNRFRVRFTWHWREAPTSTERHWADMKWLACAFNDKIDVTALTITRRILQSHDEEEVQWLSQATPLDGCPTTTTTRQVSRRRKKLLLSYASKQRRKCHCGCRNANLEPTEDARKTRVRLIALRKHVNIASRWWLNLCRILLFWLGQGCRTTKSVPDPRLPCRFISELLRVQHMTNTQKISIIFFSILMSASFRRTNEASMKRI